MNDSDVEIIQPSQMRQPPRKASSEPTDLDGYMVASVEEDLTTDEEARWKEIKREFTKARAARSPAYARLMQDRQDRKKKPYVDPARALEDGLRAVDERRKAEENGEIMPAFMEIVDEARKKIDYYKIFENGRVNPARFAMLIELRRRMVARCQVYGKNLPETVAYLTEHGVINPKTARPWSIAVVSSDLVWVKELWRQEMAQEFDDLVAELRQGIREVRRQAFKFNDLQVVLRSLEQEAKLMGLNKPERIEIDWRKEVQENMGLDAAAAFEHMVKKSMLELQAGHSPERNDPTADRTKRDFARVALKPLYSEKKPAPDVDVDVDEDDTDGES